MGKQEKLLEKLKNKSIKADELVTLLRQLGWSRRDKKSGSSHQFWRGPNGETYVISPHGKEVKDYQLNDLKKMIFKE